MMTCANSYALLVEVRTDIERMDIGKVEADDAGFGLTGSIDTNAIYGA